ncbi:MAG TPA: histidine phosphatase family protein [Pyrinomonadaceae bacterium]|nr:histidine phosphatase family protein [Pyrinomonadaceae bacterium]
MKTLFLLRHAKSSGKDESLPDFERPLHRRGKRAAATLGQYIRANEILLELILSSPAVKARETAERVLKSAKLDTELRYDHRIYDASAARLTEVVSQIDNDRRVVMIVGHNPGVEELLSFLTGNSVEAPTASLAKLTSRATRWSTLAREGKATLEWLIKPRELE